jgi:NADH:ubiquinone oxidoreductase subunit E
MSVNVERIREIFADYAPEKGNFMVLLQEVQKACGNWLPEEALKEVARLSGKPLNKVYGFVSFYSMFSTKPRGKHIIRVCKDGPCAVKGSIMLAELLMKELDVDVDETTEDGKFTLEQTACIGTCTAAPAMMIDDEVYGNVTPESLNTILKKYR